MAGSVDKNELGGMSALMIPHGLTRATTNQEVKETINRSTFIDLHSTQPEEHRQTKVVPCQWLIIGNMD